MQIRRQLELKCRRRDEQQKFGSVAKFLQPAEFRRLRNFATCENFAGCPVAVLTAFST